jgi:hypothetical protein
MNRDSLVVTAIGYGMGGGGLGFLSPQKEEARDFCFYL